MSAAASVTRRTVSLLYLQNYTKKDPESYRDDFLLQWKRYEKLFDLLRFNLEKEDNEFVETLAFVGSVAHCYPDISSPLPRSLITFMEENLEVLHPTTRLCIVKAILSMKIHKLMLDKDALPPLLGLLRCKDKNLRKLVCGHLIQEVKINCSNSRNHAYSTHLRSLLRQLLSDPNETAATKALELIINICAKGIWRDATTVNMICNCCFMNSHKVALTALHFFLGITRDENEETDYSSNGRADIMSVRHSIKVGKTTELKKRILKRLISRSKNRAKFKDTSSSYAIYLINDPYDFAEKLFLRAKQATSAIPFSSRLLFLDLLTRVIQMHKLIIVPFYEYILSYLKPSQRNISSLLAFTARGCHNMVPPNLVAAILKSIADNFIWNNVSTEIVASGLNAMREMCVRCPLAMPDDLLDSLIDDYKSHREKPTRDAARSLLNLYRTFNPSMLRKKNRGKKASMCASSVKLPIYGQEKIFPTLENLSTNALDSKPRPSATNDSGITDNSIISEEDFSETGNTDTCPSLRNEASVQIDPASEILTNEHFSILRTGKSAQSKDSSSDQSESEDMVTDKHIMKFTPRLKDYNSRMESVRRGREGREYKSSKSLKQHRGGTSNKVKSKKNKNILMVRNGKRRRSSKNKSLVKKLK